MNFIKDRLTLSMISYGCQGKVVSRYDQLQMVRQEQQQLIKMAAAAIDNYLSKTEKVNKEERAELAKFAEQYALSNQHRKFIHLIYTSLKKHLNKQNFTPTCKRFLILVDQILQISQKKPPFAQYSAAVSGMLVQCYIYVFSLIFQYQVHEAALDWKVYRMLWAKIITDQTFDALRSEISAKFRNFDLNKGFTAQSVERIKKRYSRKGFTDLEVKRYMEAAKNDPRLNYQPQGLTKASHENKRMESREEQRPRQPTSPIRTNSQDWHDQVKKKQKRDPSPISNRPRGYSEARSSSSVERPIYNKSEPIPNVSINTFYMNNPQIVHSYQPFPALPSYIKNTYISQQHQPRYEYIDKPVIPPPNQPRPFIPPPPPNAFIPSLSPYSSPEGLNREPLLKSKSQSTCYPQMKGKSSYKNLLHQLYENLYDCKQCGQFFQSKINLKNHQEEHVLSAQNEILNRQYNKACENPGSFGLMDEKFQHLLSIQNWIQRNGQQREEIQQQIRIGGELNKYNFACYFCQEQLKVTWCEPLEDWTLRESVKIKDEQGNIQFAHLSCYKEFVPKENPLGTLIQAT